MNTYKVGQANSLNIDKVYLDGVLQKYATEFNPVKCELTRYMTNSENEPCVNHGSILKETKTGHIRVEFKDGKVIECGGPAE